ncbi:MAG: copper transporter [Actinomycetota bacterium]
MITFRYHIVSIVAVFLALSVGVLFGATFIDQSIVDGLEATQERLGDRNEQLRNRTLDLEGRNEQFQTFAGVTRDATVRGVLEGQPVVTIKFDGTSDQVLESLTRTLDAAGARLDGTLTLTEQLDMSADETRERLRAALDTSIENPEALSVELARHVAEALAGINPQVLPRLAEAGLIRGNVSLPALAEDAPAQEPGPGLPAVVVVGGEVSPTFNARVIVPVTRALAEQDIVTVVGVPGRTGATLQSLRSGDLRVVTVDGIEFAMGQSLVALGLRGALDGQFGRYGTGEGATAAVPIPGP